MSPRLQECPDFVERSKLVHAQALIASSAVERLGYAIFGRIFRANEIERHDSEVTPLVERFGRKFRSMIDSYRKRQIAFASYCVQCVDNALSS